MNAVMHRSQVKRVVAGLLIVALCLLLLPVAPVKTAYAQSFTYTPESTPFIMYEGPEFGDSGEAHKVASVYIQVTDADGAQGFLIEPYGQSGLSDTLSVSKDASLEQRLVLYYGAPNTPAPAGLTNTEWSYVTQIALWCTKQSGEPRFALDGLKAASGQQELFTKLKPHIVELYNKAQGEDPYQYTFTDKLGAAWAPQEDGSWLLELGSVTAGDAWTGTLAATGNAQATLADTAGQSITQAQNGTTLALKLPKDGLVAGASTVTLTPDTVLPNFTLWTTDNPMASRDVMSTTPVLTKEPLTRKIAISTLKATVVDGDNNPLPGATVTVGTGDDAVSVPADENGVAVIPTTDGSTTAVAEKDGKQSTPQEVTLPENEETEITLVIGEPSEPENPDEPTGPDNPDTPDNPDDPNTPDEQDEPEVTLTLNPLEDQAVIEHQAITPIPVEVSPTEATIAVEGLPTGVTYNPETNQIEGTVAALPDWGKTEETRDFPVKVTATLDDKTKEVTCTITVLRDTDKDGDPDITDPDDDNDGFTDEEEKAAGSDPKDPASIPATIIGPGVSLADIPDVTVIEGTPLPDITPKPDPADANVTADGLCPGASFEDGTISGTPKITDWGKTEEVRTFPAVVEAEKDGAKAKKHFTITVLRDTDGDGDPDITDPDDDNDGFTDEEEIKAGTDPKDPDSYPNTKKPDEGDTQKPTTDDKKDKDEPQQTTDSKPLVPADTTDKNKDNNDTNKDKDSNAHKPNNADKQDNKAHNKKPAADKKQPKQDRLSKLPKTSDVQSRYAIAFTLIGVSLLGAALIANRASFEKRD